MNQNEFNAWADDYFAPETNRLDSYIQIMQLVGDFNFATEQISGVRRFKHYLKNWAQLNGYLYNPSDLCGHEGRIFRVADIVANNAVSKAVEMVYIRSNPEENGLSFDKSWIDESQSILFEEKDGLTLRDQFAMAALPALIEKYGRTPLTATWTYEVADLMLEARKVKGGEVY